MDVGNKKFGVVSYKGPNIHEIFYSEHYQKILLMVVVLTKCINESTLAQHFPAKQAPIFPLPPKENSPPLAKKCFVSNLVKVAVNIQKIFSKLHSI